MAFHVRATTLPSMPNLISVPIEAYLQPAVVVAVPTDAENVSAMLGKSRNPALPAGLQALASRHPDPVDVRVYDPGRQVVAGSAVQAWLDDEARSALGPGYRFLAVVTTEVNRPPRAGLWAVLLMGLQLATAFGGVVLDFEAWRAITVDGSEDQLKADGSIVAVGQISVLHSAPTGCGRVTSKGLSKFGLCELELRGFAGTRLPTGALLNAVAQTLIEAALAEVAKRPDFEHLEACLRIPEVLEVEPAVVRRANEWPECAGDAAKSFGVRLRCRPANADLTGFVELVPPDPAEPVDHWLDRAERWLLALHPQSGRAGSASSTASPSRSSTR